MDLVRTFGQVIGLDVVHTVLAIFAMRRWKLRALAFKREHSNAALSKDSWLDIPVGNLVKALTVYYLKQSASKWYDKPSNEIHSDG